MKRTITILLAGALLGASAIADTIYLKNGVRFDGIATPVPDQPGFYRVKTGERTLIYRESEIREIEKNDRTGKLDREALLARWEEKNRALTGETGLTAEQRRQVRGLMSELKSESVPHRLAVREKLIGLQAEFDVYGYLLTLYPELSTLMAPNVLEAMYYLDGVRSAALLKESAQSNYFGTRVMAIELLARSGAREALDLIVRGLADHQNPVKIAAAYAVANLSMKEATPALIGLLPHPDQRASNAAREALLILWAEETTESRPATVDEWKALWDRKGAGNAFELASLEPLSPEEEEFKQSFDSNH